MGIIFTFLFIVTLFLPWDAIFVVTTCIILWWYTIKVARLLIAHFYDKA